MRRWVDSSQDIGYLWSLCGCDNEAPVSVNYRISQIEKKKYNNYINYFLCGYERWSVKLKEEHKLDVFESKL